MSSQKGSVCTASATDTRPAYRGDDEVQAMYRHAEAIIYPKRAERVMQDE